MKDHALSVGKHLVFSDRHALFRKKCLLSARKHVVFVGNYAALVMKSQMFKEVFAMIDRTLRISKAT